MKLRNVLATLLHYFPIVAKRLRRSEMSEMFKASDFATGHRMYGEGKSRANNPWTGNRGDVWLAGWKAAYAEDAEVQAKALRKYAA